MVVVVRRLPWEASENHFEPQLGSVRIAEPRSGSLVTMNKPMVGPSVQPWAGGRNPVGIHGGNPERYLMIRSNPMHVRFSV